VSREAEELNRLLLRARDAMDRAYASPLDVRAVAAVAHISPAHFSRCFRAVFGESPHRYLQRRRVERSMFLLRESDRTVTTICFDVGFSSVGTFCRTFREIVGRPRACIGKGMARSLRPIVSNLLPCDPVTARSAQRIRARLDKPSHATAT
jgi:AraC-like DNA-binding protein